MGRADFDSPTRYMANLLGLDLESRLFVFYEAELKSVEL